jgi:hypothetical protein
MSYKKLLNALNGIDKALDHLIESNESEGQGDVSSMPRPTRRRIPKLDWNTLGHVAERNYKDALGFAQEAKEEGTAQIQKPKL